MTELTSKQRAHLRSLAHGLSPVVHVGADGVTEGVLRSVEEAFHNRELLKIRMQDGAPESLRETADAIVDALEDVDVVQTIGKVMVLYRRDPEDPQIQLPG